MVDKTSRSDFATARRSLPSSSSVDMEATSVPVVSEDELNGVEMILGKLWRNRDAVICKGGRSGLRALKGEAIIMQLQPSISHSAPTCGNQFARKRRREPTIDAHYNLSPHNPTIIITY